MDKRPKIDPFNKSTAQLADRRRDPTPINIQTVSYRTWLLPKFLLGNSDR